MTHREMAAAWVEVYRQEGADACLTQMRESIAAAGPDDVDLHKSAVKWMQGFLMSSSESREFSALISLAGVGDSAPEAHVETPRISQLRGERRELEAGIERALAASERAKRIEAEVDALRTSVDRAKLEVADLTANLGPIEPP